MHLESFLSLLFGSFLLLPFDSCQSQFFGSFLLLPSDSFLSQFLSLFCCYLLIFSASVFESFLLLPFDSLLHFVLCLRCCFILCSFSSSFILVTNPTAFYYILQDFCYLLFLKLAYLIYLSLLRNFSYLLTLHFSPVARYTSFCSTIANNAVRSSFACFTSVVFPFFMFSTFQMT